MLLGTGMLAAGCGSSGLTTASAPETTGSVAGASSTASNARASVPTSAGSRTAAINPSVPSVAPAPPPEPTMRNKIENFILGTPVHQNPNAATAKAASAVSELDCPTLRIRDGASTIQAMAKTESPSAMDLRHQVSFVRTARDCSLNAGIMIIKIGVQGRVTLGPAGKPGPVDVPVRYAVVQEGPEPKTITTIVRRLPVSVPDGQNRVNFSDVNDEIRFPIPSVGVLDTYVVYIGFDTEAKPEKKSKTRRVRTSKAQR
jgi:hypothetical protein